MQNLGGILNHFGKDDAWQEQRLFQMLLAKWGTVVGSSVAKHTRPTGIHRRVLQVAASSPVWAQNLSYERRRILQKIHNLGQLRSLQLKDIRFSNAEWHNTAANPNKRLHTFQQQVLWQQHPSRLPPPAPLQKSPEPQLSDNLSTNTPPQSNDANLTPSFGQWQQRRRQQNATLPPCPNCQCPTPQGELYRWSTCAFCATQQWQADKIRNQRKQN